MQSKVLLGFAVALIAIGLLKPNLSNFLDKPDNVSVVVIQKPTNEALLSLCPNVVKALSVSSDRKTDGQRLSSLYNDVAFLIELDGEDCVIKNTEEIRQANSISGSLLKLDIKGKYPELVKATQAIVVAAIGDDAVELDDNLRAKAVEAFRVLAWACQEGSK